MAWQDGVDFATRHDADERLRIKDAETLRLAPLLPVPGARDPRLVWRVPCIAVRLDATALTPAQALECVASVLDGSDAACWVRGLDTVVWQQLQDPRLHRDDTGGPADGTTPDDSTWVVQVHRPGALRGTTLAALLTSFASGEPGTASAADEPVADEPLAMRVRHVPTGRGWQVALPADLWASLPEASTGLEVLWARAWGHTPTPRGDWDGGGGGHGATRVGS